MRTLSLQVLLSEAEGGFLICEDVSPQLQLGRWIASPDSSLTTALERLQIGSWFVSNPLICREGSEEHPVKKSSFPDMS